jgi:hypothetical protein
MAANQERAAGGGRRRTGPWMQSAGSADREEPMTFAPGRSDRRERSVGEPGANFKMTWYTRESRVDDQGSDDWTLESRNAERWGLASRHYASRAGTTSCIKRAPVRVARGPWWGRSSI